MKATRIATTLLLLALLAPAVAAHDPQLARATGSHDVRADNNDDNIGASIDLASSMSYDGTTAPMLGRSGNGNHHASVSDPPRGVAGDTWADVVLGKPRFGEMGPNEITGSRVFNPGGVIVDRSVRPNRVYVYDGGNSRVLGLNHLGTCAGGPKADADCTTNSDCPSSTCTIINGHRADLVIGQPGLDGYAACNGDSNYQNYPNRAPASAMTLCSMPEYQVSPGEGGSMANMAVDSQGNLYVPDWDNHRVLFYFSPFETDTVADDVWGQADFSGNDCNEGRDVFQPDNRSLCFRSPFNEGFVGGVGLDVAGNLWVADNQNNRVLRFPYDSVKGRAGHVADLVLGQPNFTSGYPGASLDRMHAPAAVRISPSNGWLYVADSLNDRILIFMPPFISGMPASGTLGSGLRLPAAIEFDLEGNLWISDALNNQLLRFNPAGVVDRLLFKDVPTYTGQCGGSYHGDGPQFYFPGPAMYADSYNVCDSRGSIGIDSDGNILVTGSTFVQDVWRFPTPFPEPRTGIAHSADAQIFKGYILAEQNSVTARGLFSPRGIASSAAGQLIVSDAGRLLFWNDAPGSLFNGKPADGVVGAPNFNSMDPWHFGPIRADEQNRLWALQENKIEVYALPLSTGATPAYVLQPPIPVQGGGSLTWGWYLSIAGLAVAPDGSSLWLADPQNNRVIRISAPLTSPVADVVLGQPDLAGTQCNRGRGESQPSRDSVCYPGHVTLDRQGNLFISDHSLEVRGNHRLLEYDAALFPASPPTALFGIPASRVYGTNGSFTGPSCLDALCGPWETAFDPAGGMVVGLNAYLGGRFPLTYANPLVSTAPSGQLSDYYSMAYSSDYDDNGILYVGDLNRGRVLAYWPQGYTQPTRSVTAPRAGVHPIVDGDLQEWSGLDATFLDHTNAATIVGEVPTPADLSLRLRAAWAPDALYFGVTVWDNVLFGHDSSNIWEDDDLELGIYIPAAGRSHQFSFSVDGRITDQGVPISTLSAVTRTVPGGWNLEVMVPVAVLGSGPLAADQQYPFTFGYWDDDLDQGAMGQTHMIWQGDSNLRLPANLGRPGAQQHGPRLSPAHADCHLHQHAIADRHCDPHPDAHTHSDVDRHRHCDIDGIAHTHCFGYTFANTDINSHTHRDLDSDRHSHHDTDSD